MEVEIVKTDYVKYYLINGEQHGLYQVWFENAQLNEQSNYVNGKRHGLEQTWYENGQIQLQSNFINDERHGLCRVWFDNGQLWEQSNYVYGKLQKKFLLPFRH